MLMSFQDTLLAASDEIVAKWFSLALTAYPQSAALVLARNTNSFANPVGRTMLPALRGLFTALVRGDEPAVVFPHLDAIVRLRTVQEMTPAEAVAFILQLKQLVRDEAQRDKTATAQELRALEDRIDGALLMAFDIHAACREQIGRLAKEETKRRDAALRDRQLRSRDAKENAKEHAKEISKEGSKGGCRR